MMKKEIKIGLISIVVIALFYWLFIFLNGRNIFTSGEVFYVTYKDVDGLLPTKPVNVNGLKVGYVEDIKIMQSKDSLYFVVKMILNKKIDFTKNTVAEIYEPGLMAGKQIKLDLSYKGQPAQSGDTLIAANNQSLMSMLSNKLKPTQNKLDSVLVTLNGTLDKFGNLAGKDTNKSLKEILESLNKTIISLGETSNNINKLSVSTNEVVTALKSKVNDITSNTNNTLITADSTLKKYGEIASRLNNVKLDETLNNLEKSSNSLKELINKVEDSNGSLSKIINEPELYNNLNNTVNNLSSLIQDFKNKPDKYFQFSVFGKKVRYEKDTVK